MALSSPPRATADSRLTTQVDGYRYGTLHVRAPLLMLNLYHIMKRQQPYVTHVQQGGTYSGNIRQDPNNTFLTTGPHSYCFPTELVRVTYDD